MPDPEQLKVGHRVRIVGVPKQDITAFESGANYFQKETLKVLEWMVGKEFTVFEIDEFGTPWIDVVGYPDPDGAEHTMAIYDAESWILIDS